jgi:hypothetical protein
MKKTILLLVVLVAVALATSPATLASDYQPLTTEELLWDNGTEGGTINGNARGVWFTMPFDAQVITARVYIGSAAGDEASEFDMLLCPRDGGGLPDDGNPYGSGAITASGGTAGAWFDVDVSSLGVNLNSGDEFYLCYYTGADSEPDPGYDSGSDGSHNAWYNGTVWNTSSYDAYMFRVVVDDAGSQVELTTWGQIKTLDN